MSNVTKFVPAIVGDRVRFDPDQILENLKGSDIETLVIMVEDSEGKFSVYGNANGGQSLVLMEKAKRQIVFGDVDE